MAWAEEYYRCAECVIVLYYYREDNYFTDENGAIIYDLFRYITPSELFIFKQENEDLFIQRPDGTYIEIIAPDYLPY